ncbi:MAG: PhoH family protein [Elusimicrobiota bacterium]|jgi:PhoH-like ATPase
MKTFVLDTNVVIHDPEALFAFEGARVVIPLPVIEELDSFKRSNDERGRAARMVARTLDQLRQKGRLTDGVPLPHGGTLAVEMVHTDGLPAQFLSSSKDNMILGVAQYLKKKGSTVIFISKDINLRIKAESIGLDTQDYEKEKVNVDDLYTGQKEFTVQQSELDAFYKDKKLPLDEAKMKDLRANEFIILKNASGGSSSALARFDHEAHAAVPLSRADSAPWGIKPLNTEQRFAMDLLMRKEMQLVTLVGVPGSGKTLLSLAAGLEQVLNEHAYRKLLIARPVVPVGHDLGYLPGTKQEKLNTWMGAIYDNLEFLMDHTTRREDSDIDVQMLLDDGRLEVEAVAYLRGRSLPGQFILIDDAQNLTPHEIKTIISRVGRNSKIVLTGDPYQIDNYYLDSASNGLTNLVERFKGQHIFGHVKFTKIERSPLAGLAAELL